MLLAFTEAAFFIVSLFFIFYRKCTMKASVSVPIGISEVHKDHMVKLGIERKGIVPLVGIKVKMSVRNSMTGRKCRKWLKPECTGDKDMTWVYPLAFCRAGNYEISLDRVRMYDMTGLLYGTIRVKSKGKIVVLPSMYDVPVQLTAATRNFYGESEVYDPYRRGDDSGEVLDYREYRAGDRLQNVHWKMTARKDEMIVKEHAASKGCPVVLVLDFHSKVTEKNYSAMTQFLDVAASLSCSIMDAGCCHYVAWYDAGEGNLVRVRVDDEESLFECMNRLMDVSWGNSPEDVGRCYEEQYSMERYVYMLTLNERLQLKKNEELLGQIAGENLQQSLSKVELLL